MKPDSRSTRRFLLIVLNVAGSLLFLALAAGAVIELRSPATTVSPAPEQPARQYVPPARGSASPPAADSGSPDVTTSVSPDTGDLQHPAVRRRPADALPIEAQVGTRASVADAPDVTWTRFSNWDLVLLGRFLAIDDMVDEYSRYYGNDYLWQFAAYCSESTLNPMAKGTDPGDRGLGQVGDESGTTAREWLTDPSNPYYLPGFDASRTPWDPETNIVLSSVILRSFYAMPGVTDNESAYAHLTYGLAARDSSGVTTPAAAARVDRAASFLGRLTAYTQLKLEYGARVGVGEGRFAWQSDDADPAVTELLALDRTFDDGTPMYSALRGFYLEQADASDDAWTKATYIGEASTLNRLLVHVYGEADDATQSRVAAAVDQLAALAAASSDPQFVQYVDQIEAEQGLPPGP